MNRHRLHLRPAFALLAAVAATPATAADTTIQLGNGDVFSVENGVGTTRFSVDSDGNIFPSSVSYANTIIVSATGSESNNGMALEDALDGITDASASNRYLIKIEPGVYHIGADMLQMKEYVDIEGSGEGVTIVKNQGRSNSTQAAVFESASNAELRFLTLLSDSAFSYAAGVYAEGGTDVRLLHVTIETRNSSDTSYGLFLLSCGTVLLDEVSIVASTLGTSATGMYLGNCTGDAIVRNSQIEVNSATTISSGINILSTDTVLQDLEINAYGGGSKYGIQTETANITLRDVVAFADVGGNDSFGLQVDDDFTGPVIYTVNVHDSELTGTEAAVTTAPETELNIASSLLNGGVNGTYNLTCAGVYDDAYTFYASTCP